LFTAEPQAPAWLQDGLFRPSLKSLIRRHEKGVLHFFILGTKDDNRPSASH